MNDIEKLSELLTSLCDVQKRLLKLELQKKDILVKGDVNALNQLMNTEQATVMEAQNAEKQREKLQLVPAFQGKTLQTIVTEYAPNNESRLAERLTELKDTLRQLKKVNEMNKRLLQTKLQTIKYVRTVLGIGSQPVVYKKG